MSLDIFRELLNKKFEDYCPNWINSIIADIPEEWHDLLFNKEQRNLLINILDKFRSINKVDDDSKLSPRAKYIFEFARLTLPDKLRIVILGQDPYPNPNHAHGLAFSSLDKKIPHSLKNIYACLVRSKLLKSIPKTANLSAWALRGVLLLNCALTTEVGKSNYHASLWREYTDILIENISKKYKEDNRKLIFMLWGGFAQNKERLIEPDEPYHHILTWRHPSPLAQNCDEEYRFINCDNFKKVNTILGYKFDWNPKKKIIEAYTDGSAYPNKNTIKAKNGYACIFTNGFLDNLAIYGTNEQCVVSKDWEGKLYATAPRAEGTAILKVIEKVNSIPVDKWDEVHIVTDSHFWYDMIIQFMPNWEKNAINFNTKKNPDISIKLWKEIKKLRKNGVLNIRHIRSHGSGGLKDAEENTQEWYDYINNKCVDELANLARKKLKYGEYKEDIDILDSYS